MSTIWPRSTYSHRRPSSRGLAVNGGQCSRSVVPAIGMTWIPGTGTGSSQGSGSLQCTASNTVTWLSVSQPSSAPSRGTGMLPVIAWQMMPETGSPGRISWLTPSQRFHERMTKRSSRAWVRSKKPAVPAAWLIRTIDRYPPSAECGVTASG